MSPPASVARGRRRVVRLGSLALCFAFVAYLLHTQKSYGQRTIPTPRSTSDQCRLHYSHFHLLFTLPPLLLLFLIARPFLSALDWYKLYTLPVIAFVWTTPWDNELVRMGAWWYPSSCVLARVGYVPVEEYAFFIIQSLATTLLTTWMTRWSTPRSGKSFPAARLLPAASAAVVVLGLYNLLVHEDGQESRYYLSMILWWAAIPLTLLLWGTCQSWAVITREGQGKYYLLSILLSTVYLCCADVFALRRGTWHISERRSLQIFAIDDLPIEEALFFLATNSILVCACFAFDRVVWKMRGDEEAGRSHHQEMFAPLSPTHFHISSFGTVKRIWSAFTRLDAGPSKSNTEAVILEHRQQRCFDILSSASKTFSAAAALLPWDLRVDLSSVYAFARAMDDFIDQPKNANDLADDRIARLRALVSEMYASNSTDLSAGVEKYHSDGKEEEGEKKHWVGLRVTALAARQLRSIIPERLWQDLIDGLSTDCSPHGPHFVDFAAQADYSQSVAGAIGEMCVRIIIARSGHLVPLDYIVSRDVSRESLLSSSPRSVSPHHQKRLNSNSLRSSTHAPASLEADKVERMLRDARRMGVSLQLVNIARDVVQDSIQLHRCYLVTGLEDLAGIRQALCDANIDIEVDLQQGSTTKTTTSKEEEEKAVQRMVGQSPALSRKAIFAEKEHLLNLADAIYASCIDSIEMLPSPAARTGLRVACAVYANIGTVIRRKGAQRCLEKSTASTWERIYVAIKTAYLP